MTKVTYLEKQEQVIIVDLQLSLAVFNNRIAKSKLDA